MFARKLFLHLLHTLRNTTRISINTADKLSMTVVLTAMNRFLNEDNGLQMAFLDGNQPERLCAPMKDYIEARGGEVRVKSPVKEIVTNEDGTVKHLLMRTGEIIGTCST
jgi:15-cis-phytoene desaturase